MDFNLFSREESFFGREVGFADRTLLPTFQLKSRTYLGPTDMDAEMAFLMANQAKATSGKLVYDPFVGTGSILVSAARFGAMTMGADIDIRVVRDGRGPDCNVWSNFKQYGLPMPVALLRMDNNLPPWRSRLKEIFDAHLTGLELVDVNQVVGKSLEGRWILTPSLMTKEQITFHQLVHIV